MLIRQRAGNIARQLTEKGVGELPLVFVAHSMGGLIAKAIVVEGGQQSDPAWRTLAGNVRGLAFLGTPHRGSPFATAASVLFRGMWGAQAHVRQMQDNATELDLQHDRFLAWHGRNPIPVTSFAETRGVTKRRWFWRPLRLPLVVSRSSANPGVGSIVDVDADHFELVKPHPAQDANYTIVYVGVRRFLDAALRDQSVPPPSQRPPELLVALWESVAAMLR
jgi:pimeloyl-ACP methyl ester carboxylesterase